MVDENTKNKKKGLSGVAIFFIVWGIVILAIILFFTLRNSGFTGNAINVQNNPDTNQKTCQDTCSYTGNICQGNDIYSCEENNGCKKEIFVGSCSDTQKCVNGKCVQNCHDVQVPYQDTETYTDSEPYTTQKCSNTNAVYKINTYDMVQSCQDQECANYNQVCSNYNWLGNCVSYTNGDCSKYNCVKYNIRNKITIDNKEKQDLTFNIQLNKYNQDTKQLTPISTQNVVVPALDSKEVDWDFVQMPSELSYGTYNLLKTPQIQVCNDVIAYHDIQKTRPVTKYRTEQQCN